MPTTVRELLIYLAVTIYIGLLLESDIKDYWTINCKRGVDYFIVRENISKDR
jgi:hypothetical protein